MATVERILFALGALESAAIAALVLWLYLQYPEMGVMGLIAPVVVLIFGALCARQAREASA
ncbi:hypothetical protein ACFQMA_14235 [Halosimplex aquaticum]|uniref:Major facilitator superfamily (MFS) profile domain-containing protein n=1 Tax=Halosimplex aquaticum TaxID=3026162 RepID=A0ABD5Y979_9EURY|nr:hypothetical protein [Halosimplex aquaticum]